MLHSASQTLAKLELHIIGGGAVLTYDETKQGITLAVAVVAYFMVAVKKTTNPVSHNRDS